MEFKKTEQHLSFDEFKEVLSEVLQVNPERVAPEAYFITDLGVDSIRMVELLLRIQELGIDISPDAGWEIQTVEDAYNYYLERADSGSSGTGSDTGPA
jgi:acyl carrier protein